MYDGDTIAFPECFEALSPDDLLKGLQQSNSALHSCYGFQSIHLRTHSLLQTACHLRLQGMACDNRLAAVLCHEATRWAVLLEQLNMPVLPLRELSMRFLCCERHHMHGHTQALCVPRVLCKLA